MIIQRAKPVVLNRLLLLVIVLIVGSPIASAQFEESFEGLSPGSFPPAWQDAALVNPIGPVTTPSATVVATTDPQGLPTQALGY